MQSDDETRERQLAEMADQSELGFLREFGHFLRHNKKWWLIPLLASLLLLGLVSFLASSAAAPFIYTIF